MTPAGSAPGRLQKLYEDSYRPLVGALTLATGHRDDAEEIAQEAFARLVSHWSRVADFDDPSAWVRMVAFRLVVDRRRRLLRVARKYISGSDANVVDRDSAVDIQRAVTRLPLAQRQVVLLHYVYDMRVEDVANTLGVRIGTVKSRLGRARSALGALLREEALRE